MTTAHTRAVSTKPNVRRHPANPILTPGAPAWRQAAVFNPGVIVDDGRFYLLERATESLAPMVCRCSLMESDNGVHFTLAEPNPVFGPEDLGHPRGTVEDPRVVKIDGRFYLTYAHRPVTWNCFPQEGRLPHYTPVEGAMGDPLNQTISGIAVSDDLRTWEHICYTNTDQEDDRDVILFPEKINGRFAMLRRPLQRVGTKFGCTGPSIWITFSDDLVHWDEPTLLAKAIPGAAWENGKVGGSAPPVRTDAGWLMLYHGVDANSVYRVGAMLLDGEDPTIVIGRTREPIMEPTEPYELQGALMPNVIFPTANIVRDGELWIYYGCCDTTIALATVPLDQLLAHLTD